MKSLMMSMVALMDLKLGEVEPWKRFSFSLTNINRSMSDPLSCKADDCIYGVIAGAKTI